jgi:hypothetical protein
MSSDVHENQVVEIGESSTTAAIKENKAKRQLTPTTWCLDLWFKELYGSRREPAASIQR